LARPRRSDHVADDLTENTAALQEPIGELLQRIGRRVCTAFLGHTNPAPTARAAQTEPNRRPLAPRVPHPRGHKGRSLPADGASLASRQNRASVLARPQLTVGPMQKYQADARRAAGFTNDQARHGLESALV
jgi:hypothetical protein